MNVILFLTYILWCFYFNEAISSRVCCYIDHDYYNVVVEDFSRTLKDTCPLDTTTVSFLNGTVSKISNDFLTGMKKLYRLNISNVYLEKLEPGAFDDLPTVRFLTLRNNNLTVIKSGSFRNLSEVYISLDKNQISNLDKRAFVNLYEKNQIDLNQNKLTEIKKGVFENITLSKLDLSKNRIFKVEIGAFSSFLKSGGLMELDLRANKLKKVNPAVFNNPFLTLLDLASNEISQLRPNDLANLPEIHYLNLSHNKLKNIPKGVFNYTKTGFLYLGNNQLSTIASGAFHNMPYLTKVDLNFNKLTSWDSNWFHGCLKLTTLYAANNAIQKIPEDAFKNLPRLRALDLSVNHIKAITSHPFKNRVWVNLIMKDNELEEWGEDFKDEIKISRFLDLRGNKIPCPQDGSKSFSSARDVLSSCDDFLT